MKTFLRTLIIVCVLTFAVGAIKTIVTNAYSNQVSAMGFGEISGDFLDTTTKLAFNAVQQADGIVTGQAEYHFVRDNPFFPENFGLHIEVNCLNIGPDGKTATISGVVKNSSNPEAEGSMAIFRVRDNGEGNSNETDGITPVFLSLPELNRNCNVLTGIQPTPITAGNIQVKP